MSAAKGVGRHFPAWAWLAPLGLMLGPATGLSTEGLSVQSVNEVRLFGLRELVCGHTSDDVELGDDGAKHSGSRRIRVELACLTDRMSLMIHSKGAHAHKKQVIRVSGIGAQHVKLIILPGRGDEEYLLLSVNREPDAWGSTDDVDLYNLKTAARVFATSSIGPPDVLIAADGRGFVTYTPLVVIDKADAPGWPRQYFIESGGVLERAGGLYAEVRDRFITEAESKLAKWEADARTLLPERYTVLDRSISALRMEIELMKEYSSPRG